jgi:hypothetical protein
MAIEQPVVVDAPAVRQRLADAHGVLHGWAPPHSLRMPGVHQAPHVLLLLLMRVPVQGLTISNWMPPGPAGTPGGTGFWLFPNGPTGG